MYYLDLVDPKKPRLDGTVVKLLDDFDASYEFIGNDGGILYVLTNLDAPRYRVIAVRAERGDMKEIIPEAEDVLEDVRIIDGKFVASYLTDAHSRIAVFNRDGSGMKDLELPTLGSVSSITGERKDREMFYAFESFLYPTTIYRYDFETGTTSVFRAPQIAFDGGAFVTEQVFYPSKDGTKIPMFVTHKRGLELDGTNPIYLYGYGGFNISLRPRFSVSNLVWLELGGVYAQANLLGGGSNGGLLVGAVMNQRPELFGVGLPAVGVMDMLRFHKFTIGWAWVSDYGSSENAEEFETLHAYSPYHRLRPAAYFPATLVTTADHDDRVVPGHSFKYAARLQEIHGDEPRPMLIRIQTNAGHGAGKPTSMIIAEQADRWAFVMENLGIAWPE